LKKKISMWLYINQYIVTPKSQLLLSEKNTVIND